MTFKANEVIKISDGGYCERNVSKRRKDDRQPVDQAHAAASKGLGWKTKFIGIKSHNSVDRLLYKWIGKNYNLLMSKLSIDKSFKGRILRDSVRAEFDDRGSWFVDGQNRIQKKK